MAGTTKVRMKLKRVFATAAALTLALAPVTGCDRSGAQEPLDIQVYTSGRNSDGAQENDGAREPGEDTPNGQPETTPDVTQPGRFGRLTEGIMEIFEGGTFHLKLLALDSDLAGIESEHYYKDGMAATLSDFEGEMTRFVTKDGKTYIVRDTARTAFSYDAPAGDDEWPLISSDWTYVCEGSGDFNGRTYAYDEYTDSTGAQYFYYVDNGNLAGVRIIERGESIDIDVIVFDQNVPDEIFNIPEDYLTS